MRHSLRLSALGRELWALQLAEDADGSRARQVDSSTDEP